MVAPVQIAPVVLEKQIPKVDGLGVQKNWKFEIVDANLIPRQYLKPDEVAIGGVVRSTKGAVTIPGVRIYSEDSFRRSA